MTLLVLVVLAAYHLCIIAHSILILHNAQSLLKCPLLQDSEVLFDFHTKYYSLAILTVTIAEFIEIGLTELS